MFGLGFSEIVVLAILALILLGPDQLPDLARTIGRFVNDLKRTTDDLKSEFKNSGFNPHSLLEDIQRERQQPPEPDVPPEKPLNLDEETKPHHESHDSGKKPDSN